MLGDGFGKALARQHAGADLDDGRAQSPDVAIVRQQFQPVIEARSRLEQSRVKMVTSSARGLLNSASVTRETDATPSSDTVSIGTSPRYSMRRATSDAVGADSDPFTSSPLWVMAR
jgi:hypothetical protein